MKISIALIFAFICLSALGMEKGEGIVYCNGKTIIEYRLINPDRNGAASDVDLTVNGRSSKYMTAYSWFGSNQPTPKDFRFAILGEKQFDPLLVFKDHLQDARGIKYNKCN